MKDVVAAYEKLGQSMAALTREVRAFGTALGDLKKQRRRDRYNAKMRARSRKASHSARNEGPDRAHM